MVYRLTAMILHWSPIELHESDCRGDTRLTQLKLTLDGYNLVNESDY